MLPSSGTISTDMIMGPDGLNIGVQTMEWSALWALAVPGSIPKNKANSGGPYVLPNDWWGYTHATGITIYISPDEFTYNTSVCRTTGSFAFYTNVYPIVPGTSIIYVDAAMTTIFISESDLIYSISTSPGVTTGTMYVMDTHPTGIVASSVTCGSGVGVVPMNFHLIVQNPDNLPGLQVSNNFEIYDQTSSTMLYRVIDAAFGVDYYQTIDITIGHLIYIKGVIIETSLSAFCEADMYIGGSPPDMVMTFGSTCTIMSHEYGYEDQYFTVDSADPGAYIEFACGGIVSSLGDPIDTCN